MVRLKEKQFANGFIEKIEFQFHYGTIKRRYKKKKKYLQRQFQFHYGTIKSLIHCHTAVSCSQFQFHYGTIKSMKVSKLLTKNLFNFNSIMVRLKDTKVK